MKDSICKSKVSIETVYKDGVINCVKIRSCNFFCFVEYCTTDENDMVAESYNCLEQFVDQGAIELSFHQYMYAYIYALMHTQLYLYT